MAETRITKAQLEEWGRQTEAATPAPWVYVPEEFLMSNGQTRLDSYQIHEHYEDDPPLGKTYLEADAQFVCMARSVMPLLIERMKELESREAGMQKYLRRGLRDLMSNISEEEYCAGWLGGLEYSLWAIVVGDAETFGDLEGMRLKWYTSELRRLSELTDGWWIWSDEPFDTVTDDDEEAPVHLDQGERFIPMSEWLPLYETHNVQYQKNLKKLAALAKGEEKL